MNSYEKIKSMTIEEMAVELAQLVLDFQVSYTFGTNLKIIKQWLNEEAE